MGVVAMKRKWMYKMDAGIAVYCGICGEPISKGGDKFKGNLTVDHILPKSLGGTNLKQNLQPAHQICNRVRGNTVLHEFKDAKTKEQVVLRAIEIIQENDSPYKQIKRWLHSKLNLKDTSGGEE